MDCSRPNCHSALQQHAVQIARVTSISATSGAYLPEGCGYQFVQVLPDLFGSGRAVQVHCSRTNRLHTLLQIPREQLQHVDSGQRQQLLSELQLASSLHHPHMLQVWEVFVGPLHLHVVLEECSAGRLLDYPAKRLASSMHGPAFSTAACSPALSPDFARWFLQQLVLAVHYCHAKGMTGLAVEHALLKVVPNLPQPVVKLPTQVLARGPSAAACSAQHPCNSDFRPPEESEPNSCQQTSARIKADVWACGVVLVMLLGGQLCQLQALLQQWDQQVPGLATLLRGMLHPDPTQRYTVEQILQDPWFRQQLPPTAADMTARYLAKPSTCRQSAQDIADVLNQAWAVDPSVSSQVDVVCLCEEAQAQASLALQQYQQAQCSSFEVYASADDLLKGLELHQTQQQHPTRDITGCVTLQAMKGGQAVQVVGLASQFGPSTPTAAAVRDPAPKSQDPELSLVSQAHNPAMQLAATLQELQAAQQDISTSAPALAPIKGMCLDPPLLVLQQPAGGILDQWIRRRVRDINSGSVGATGDFTAAWVQDMPWRATLQVLRHAAAALATLHQQQPALVHGGVHAAAVHLTQQLPEGAAAERQEQAGSTHVAQLSLSGLLSQLSPISSIHPFLCAPEVLLASGRPTPAVDVYGFGVLLFQLATGWLPQQYTPGTDEQIHTVIWCRDMMVQAGSMSPLAAAEHKQLHGTTGMATGTWTPYGQYLLSEAAKQHLPAGYLSLMQACLDRVPDNRPSITEVIVRLQDFARADSGLIQAVLASRPGGVSRVAHLLPPNGQGMLHTAASNCGQHPGECRSQSGPLYHEVLDQVVPCPLVQSASWLKGQASKAGCWLSGGWAAGGLLNKGTLPAPVPAPARALSANGSGGGVMSNTTSRALLSGAQGVALFVTLATVLSSGPLQVALSCCPVG